MARCAALYFRKKRSHAPGPTTIIAEPAGGAFIEGSKAQRAQHASHDREKCAGCRLCRKRIAVGARMAYQHADLYNETVREYYGFRAR